MRRGIPAVMILVLGLTLISGVGLYAQVKKDKATGLDRIEGTIQSINKDKSMVMVKQGGTVNPVWQVTYDAKTKITMLNKPGKLEDLKDGMRVIVLGKAEKETMAASRIEIRTGK